MLYFQIKLTEAELHSICLPCRDRLKTFYEYYIFVLENQIKFETNLTNQPLSESVKVTVSSKTDDARKSEHVAPIKDEPELSEDSYEDEDQSLEADSLCDESHKLNDKELIVKIDPDHVNKSETQEKSSRSSKRRRKRPKLTAEERDEISREKDELIKRFIVLKCEQCPQIESFPDFASLMSHSRQKHHKEAIVKCCGREIKTKFLLASHLQMHINVPTCEKCGETFRTNRKLQSHQKVAHAICDICNLDLRRKKLKPVDVWSHAQQHLLSSDPNKPAPFICDLCGKTVKDRNRFKAHIKYTHYDNVASVCESCGLSFRFKHQYTEHKRIQHPNGSQKVPCEICGVAIRNNDKAMQAHIENVHRAQPTLCPVCGLTCKSKKAMQTHYKRNHTEKKYVCRICSKAFSMGKRLKEHEAIHLGVSLYTCGWCGAEFKSSGNFSAHKRKLHPIEYANEKARNEAKKYEL